MDWKGADYACKLQLVGIVAMWFLHNFFKIVLSLKLLEVPAEFGLFSVSGEKRSR